MTLPIYISTSLRRKCRPSLKFVSKAVKPSFMEACEGVNKCLFGSLFNVLISFWKALSGAILAREEYCNDFGHVQFFKCLSSLTIEFSILTILPPLIDGPYIFILSLFFSGYFCSGGLFSLVSRAGGLGCDGGGESS